MKTINSENCNGSWKKCDEDITVCLRW